ncbi:MAG: LPS-assembly protein LptD [Bacteroidales bacterium]|nr:LPS-assembly protein LptD [Bacteroidales bacterium]MBN2818567.1 LPS-assembly protein LptD [Bacteroidales bacterium]
MVNRFTKIALKLFSLSRAKFVLSTTSLLISTMLCAQQPDSLRSVHLPDSVLSNPADTLKKEKKQKKSIVDDPVYYESVDSMTMVVGEKRVYLYGKGNVKYQDFELTSDYIESDLNKKEVFANGVSDTTGKYLGRPLFKQGGEEFESDSLIYNLESGKGLIYNVKTEQGEGYLHSELTKRDNEGHVHVKGGKYTTCNLDHPHFYMELTKAIVIPDDKIISGPAYLIVADVPIPLLGLPFGFFPNSKQRGAGIILPTYGDEQTRGFYLRNGGWYQPLGEYLDMQFLGDVYTKGSFGLQWGSSYLVRYKFGGSMRINYNENIKGGAERGDPDTEISKDFRWTWNHRQDAKANPTQSFSANVNFSSSGFDLNNSYGYQDRLTNQKSSSISYTKNWPGTPFNLSLSANARQNTSTKTVNIDLPTGSFNASTIYPFRKKDAEGVSAWYQDILDNIGFSYNSRFSSELQDVVDTMIFYRETWKNMDFDFSHSVPFVINLKSKRFKMLTVSPSLSYQGRFKNWYTKKTVFQPNLYDDAVLQTDTIRNYIYAHAINPSISFGLTPKVYGMFINTRSDPRVIAVRHVIQPRASFSYTPDMRFINPNYYDTLYYFQDGELERETYSYLNSPPSSAGRNGVLSLSLGNNLEMKVKDKSDTTGTKDPKKVSLIRNLNASTSYNPFVEEFHWRDVNISGSTQLFNNKLNLQVNNKYSLYDLEVDSVKGKKTVTLIDEFYYRNGKGLARFTYLSVSAGFSLRSEQGTREEEQEEQVDEFNTYQDPLNPDFEFVPGYSAANNTYVDFSIPWTLRVDYSWTLNRPKLMADQTITHTLGFHGDFSLTPKWKIGFNSGYDLVSKEVTFTNINVHRDLHCWEMTFRTVPFGTARNFNFTIRAKSSILRDLKYEKKQSWYDNF